MNDHEKWEANIRARRNFILLVGGSALLALILVLFWWNNRSPDTPFTSPLASTAPEGEQAQPPAPATATAVDPPPALDPNFDRRTLVLPGPVVSAADEPAPNRPTEMRERIVIGSNVVDQFEAATAAPAGWSYLAGADAPIFRLQENGDGQGNTVMLVDTQRNAGILQKEVNIALDPDTTLSWQWNVLDLPSEVPEDTAATHDFFSIAVRFDNGRDLTYMWSADLLDGTSFRCPLPERSEQETHVVVRSGEIDLNKWLREQRSVMADYQRYVGGELPTRITHIWLTASSDNQNGEGRAVFMDIAVDGAQRQQLL